jgi:hypothetical protein
MPSTSKTAAGADLLNDDAIRQRAYYLWESDGRPAGRDEHYWSLACEAARQELVEATGSRTAEATGGKNPSEAPEAVKAGRATKPKAKAADEPKAAKPVKATKTAEVKKTPKPRAAIQTH